MKSLIEQLCENINNEAHRIVSTVNTNSQFQSDVFDDPVKIDIKKKNIKSLRGRKGVYIFIVRYSVSLNKAQVMRWNNKIGGGKFKEYKAIEILDGDCLYLGSCVRKSLYSRIKEHFSDSGSYQALKLGHPVRKALISDVYCMAFPIQKKYSDQQYRILLPAIEKKLHELMVPLCGSNRT